MLITVMFTTSSHQRSGARSSELLFVSLKAVKDNWRVDTLDIKDYKKFCSICVNGERFIGFQPLCECGRKNMKVFSVMVELWPCSWRHVYSTPILATCFILAWASSVKEQNGQHVAPTAQHPRATAEVLLLEPFQAHVSEDGMNV